jgi:STE24 endopeptidase
MAASATGAGDSLAAAGDSARTVADSVATAAVRDTLAAAAAPRRNYLAEVRANFTPETRAYANTKVVLALVEPVFSILILAVFLFSGFSARLRDVARTLGHRRYVQVLVYFTLFSILLFAVFLPLAWYSEFALEHQYGLSNQRFLEWLTDDLKQLAFSIGIFGVLPILALAYRALQRHPRTWWLWLSGGAVVFILISVFLTPLVYDPAFNKFTPLPDSPLKREILALATRAGVQAEDVYQVDKSAQTVKYNAYVTGFGSSARVVLWDTTLKGMEPDEILFITAHELGHYRLNHVWEGVLFTCLLAVAALFVASRIVKWAIRRFGESWDIAELHDIATLPLFGIVFVVLSALAQPASAAFSRAIEHEADGFAIEMTHDNDAGARAFLKLGSQNRSNPEPSPFVRAMLYDHPPLAERIRFALDYRPWERREPNRWYHGLRPSGGGAP